MLWKSLWKSWLREKRFGGKDPVSQFTARFPPP
jgi:hypothetical protein